jgi:aminoglycoside phosphotransferase (APT) family kinase protein
MDLEARPMTFDVGIWKLIWDITQALILVAIGFYTWWQTRERVTREAIAEIDRRLHQIDRAIDGRPEFTHFDGLRDQLAENNQRLSEVSARLEATTALLNRLHDYLLHDRSDKR